MCARPRIGLTLLELLVVLSILAILISMLTVAVHAVRASSRKLKCQNNLRQLGIANSGFLDRTGHFPTRYSKVANTAGTEVLVGPFWQILPELEVPFAGSAPDDVGFVPNDRESYLPPTTLRCPASNDFLGYRFSLGHFPSSFKIEGVDSNGMLDPIQPIRASDVTDGLSNTIHISERVTKDNERIQLPAAMAIVNRNSVDVEAACEQAARLGNGVSKFALEWWSSSYNHFGFNHNRPPNFRSIDCQWRTESGSIVQALSARSLHGEGVNALRGDGSVQWFSSNIDTRVWTSLGTRARGD